MPTPLLQPTKRSPKEALPSALHLTAAVTLSMLVFAAINVAVTLTHGPRNPWTKLVQSGCMVCGVQYENHVFSFLRPCLHAQ